MCAGGEGSAMVAACFESGVSDQTSVALVLAKFLLGVKHFPHNHLGGDSFDPSVTPASMLVAHCFAHAIVRELLARNVMLCELRDCNNFF